MADNKIRMPSGFGGLTRFDDEYRSRFMITPAQAIGFTIAILVFITAIKLVWPIS